MTSAGSKPSSRAAERRSDPELAHFPIKPDYEKSVRAERVEAQRISAPVHPSTGSGRTGFSDFVQTENARTPKAKPWIASRPNAARNDDDVSDPPQKSAQIQ